MPVSLTDIVTDVTAAAFNFFSYCLKVHLTNDTLLKKHELHKKKKKKVNICMCVGERERERDLMIFIFLKIHIILFSLAGCRQKSG